VNCNKCKVLATAISSVEYPSHLLPSSEQWGIKIWSLQVDVLFASSVTSGLRKLMSGAEYLRRRLGIVVLIRPHTINSTNIRTVSCIWHRKSLWLNICNIYRWLQSLSLLRNCCSVIQIGYEDYRIYSSIPKWPHPCASEHSRSMLQYGNISPHVLYSSTVQQVSSTDCMFPTLQYVTYCYGFSLYRSYTFIGIQCPT
jgi:hypothetical protein